MSLAHFSFMAFISALLELPGSTGHLLQNYGHLFRFLKKIQVEVGNRKVHISSLDVCHEGFSHVGELGLETADLLVIFPQVTVVPFVAEIGNAADYAEYLVAACGEFCRILFRERGEIVVHMFVYRFADATDRIIQLFHIVEHLVEPCALPEAFLGVYMPEAQCLFSAQILEFDLFLLEFIA